MGSVPPTGLMRKDVTPPPTIAAGLEAVRGLLPAWREKCHSHHRAFRASERPVTDGDRTLSERLCESFRPDRARGVRAIVEVRTGKPSARSPAKLELADGGCTPAAPRDEPTVSLELEEGDLEAWLRGERQLVDLLVSGRLEVSGDVMIAVRLPDFFGAPA